MKAISEIKQMLIVNVIHEFNLYYSVDNIRGKKVGYSNLNHVELELSL